MKERNFILKKNLTISSAARNVVKKKLALKIPSVRNDVLEFPFQKSRLQLFRKREACLHSKIICKYVFCRKNVTLKLLFFHNKSPISKYVSHYLQNMVKSKFLGKTKNRNDKKLGHNLASISQDWIKAYSRFVTIFSEFSWEFFLLFKLMNLWRSKYLVCPTHQLPNES